MLKDMSAIKRMGRKLEIVIGDHASGCNYIMESLILAQNERWRRVLSMQVERYKELAP